MPALDGCRIGLAVALIPVLIVAFGVYWGMGESKQPSITQEPGVQLPQSPAESDSLKLGQEESRVFSIEFVDGTSREVVASRFDLSHGFNKSPTFWNSSGNKVAELSPKLVKGIFEITKDEVASE